MPDSRKRVYAFFDAILYFSLTVGVSAYLIFRG